MHVESSLIGTCYFVLADSILYYSVELLHKNQTDSPFSPWEVYFNLNDIGITDTVATFTTNSPDYFYIATSDTIYTVYVSSSLSFPEGRHDCGFVSKVLHAFSLAAPRNWGKQPLITTGNDDGETIWIASTESGLIKIAIEDDVFEDINLPYGGTLSTYIYRMDLLFH